MRDFLHAIKRIYTENMVATFNNIIMQHIPCAYFSTLGLDEIKNNVKLLQRDNVNLQVIYTINNSYTGIAGDIPVIYLTPMVLEKIAVKYVITDHWEVTRVYSILFEERGICTFGISHLKVAGDDLTYMFNHLEDYYRTYTCFDDEQSRKSYLGVLVGNATSRLGDYHFAPEPQYFLDGFYPQKGDIVIDGGAYDGATAREYASLGSIVYAFEMDKENYVRCYEAAEKYGFIAENMGLWKDEKCAKYAPGKAGSSMDDNGTEEAYFTSIDIYVEKNGLPRVDYIKLDVEGAELDVLRGAVKSIVKFHPTMAISGYHRPEDMWKLRDYISGICPKYKFAYRHYPIDAHDYFLNEIWRNEFRRIGLDLYVPSHWEHVLYCKYEMR